MSSKGWSVYFKSSLQIHYSWAWGTCLVPLLSLSCCGWWCASHTSVVSLMCSVLPCRGAKLSVLSRWHWMCCIAGRRYCARLWFSWKLSKQSWSSIVSQKAQPPFVGWWQVQSVHTLLWAAQGRLPMLRWGGGGSRVLGSTSLVLLCFPHATHFALHLRRGSILFCLLWESLTLWAPRQRRRFPPLWLGAAGQTLEAARRCWPQSLPPALGSLAGAAQLIALWVQGRRHAQQRQVKCCGVLALPENPPSLLFCPPLTSLSPFPAWTAWGYPHCVTAAFSEVRKACLQKGEWALAMQGCMSKTSDYEVSFLVIKPQLGQWLHWSER